MAGNVKPVPEGYHTVTPYLMLKEAGRALDFYKHALGAVEVMRLAAPDGRLMHAEIRIGDSRIMMGQESPQWPELRGVESFHGSPVSIYLYVEDVDALFKRAVSAGAKIKKPVTDEFYGDRVGGVEDPFGLVWWISTHKEDLSAEEVGKRAAAARH
jgi:PhnB protein